MNPIAKQTEQQLRDVLNAALKAAVAAGELPDEPLPEFTVEIPADRAHGDLAANAAMVSARAFRKAPRMIADCLVSHLNLEGTYLARAEVAAPGFLNFFLSPTYYADAVAAVIEQGEVYGRSDYGAGKKERILKSYFVSLTYSFVIGLIFGITLVVFGRQFLSLFTTEEAVIETGLYRLQLMGLCYCVSAFMDCTIAASRGLGKSVVPTVLVILGSCVFRILWIYTVFAYFHTITSLYLLYVFSWTITAALEAVYFVRCYRQQLQALEQHGI